MFQPVRVDKIIIAGEQTFPLCSISQIFLTCFCERYCGWNVLWGVCPEEHMVVKLRCSRCWSGRCLPPLLLPHSLVQVSVEEVVVSGFFPGMCYHHRCNVAFTVLAAKFSTVSKQCFVRIHWCSPKLIVRVGFNKHVAKSYVMLLVSPVKTMPPLHSPLSSVEDLRHYLFLCVFCLLFSCLHSVLSNSTPVKGKYSATSSFLLPSERTAAKTMEHPGFEMSSVSYSYEADLFYSVCLCGKSV